MQAHLHEVDAGQRDHHVAGEHHTAAEQPVEQVDQGDLARARRPDGWRPRRSRRVQRREGVRRPGTVHLEASLGVRGRECLGLGREGAAADSSTR